MNQSWDENKKWTGEFLGRSSAFREQSEEQQCSVCQQNIVIECGAFTKLFKGAKTVAFSK